MRFISCPFRLVLFNLYVAETNYNQLYLKCKGKIKPAVGLKKSNSESEPEFFHGIFSSMQ